MKVKILKKCFIGTGNNLMPNEEHEIEDRIANKLIARKYVEPVKSAKPKAAKKTNRSVGLEKSDAKLETPESE